MNVDWPNTNSWLGPALSPPARPFVPHIWAVKQSDRLANKGRFPLRKTLNDLTADTDWERPHELAPAKSFIEAVATAAFPAVSFHLTER